MVIVIIGVLATISVASFSGYFERARDAERKWHFNAIEKALLTKYVFEDDFRALGTGWRDGGNGWLNYGTGNAASAYEDSIISYLIGNNYLSHDYKDKLQGDFGYMFYACDYVGTQAHGFSLSATREGLRSNEVDINGTIYELEGTLTAPTVNDENNIYSKVCNGPGSNSIFSRYGKNVVISHRRD